MKKINSIQSQMLLPSEPPRCPPLHILFLFLKLHLGMKSYGICVSLTHLFHLALLFSSMYIIPNDEISFFCMAVSHVYHFFIHSSILKFLEMLIYVFFLYVFIVLRFLLEIFCCSPNVLVCIVSSFHLFQDTMSLCKKM